MPSYWWVNHKQTYRQETDGGYTRKVSYDNLTRFQRGELAAAAPGPGARWL